MSPLLRELLRHLGLAAYDLVFRVRADECWDWEVSA